MAGSIQRTPNRPFGSRTVRTGAVLVALAMLGAALGHSANATSARHTSSVNVCPKNPEPGYATCLALRRTDIVPRKHSELASTATPSGFAPADLISAYRIPTNLGSGATVAIVDAYDDPSAEADLGVYRSQYGLTACTIANGCFSKVSQTGSTTNLPRPNTGWATEIALDLQMVSAACPLCHILLVEAASDYYSDLNTAENLAAARAGVRAVSNSWGGNESSSDPTTGNTYYNHPGVAITAAAGDDGFTTEFPATLPYVISVGGTALEKASNTRGWTESVWDTSNSEGTGSGCSRYQTKPAWQTDSGCTKRTMNDVSAVADPDTGVAIYDSYGSGGWTVMGGTSVGTPLIAAMYAEANNPSPSPKYLYQGANTAGLYDVTDGQNSSNCGSYLCKAQAGFDGPTGMGTPNGLLALGGSTSGTGAAAFTMAVSPQSASVAPGGQASATVTTATSTSPAPTLNLSVSAPSGVTATLSAASLTAGTPATLTVTSAATTPPGTYPVTITATGAGATATATYTLTLTSPCPTTNQLTNPGLESGNASWATTPNVIGKWSGAGAPHTGSWSAWLDGYNSSRTDTLTQTVALPAACRQATVSFWMRINTNSSAKNATLTVSLGGTTIATYTNLNHNSGYQQFVLPAAALPAGASSTTLQFSGTQTNSTPSSFVIDDASLTLS